jgi:alpha-L-arabinofuranosidase
MAVKIPEFILSGMFEKGSLQNREEGFSFVLKNSYAPATILGFSMKLDGKAIPPSELSLQLDGGLAILQAEEIGDTRPLALPVNRALTIMVGRPLVGEGKLRICVLTREVGELSFSVKTSESARNKPGNADSGLSLLKGFFYKVKPPLKAFLKIRSGEPSGTIDPMVYGHFVEHLENCVYDGIWDQEGKSINKDVVELIKQVAPPVIRYPGGNFASDYHWEDGVGPAEARPICYNHAWHVEETNRIGTNEFLQFCREVGAEPLLVVNDGSGTAEEAARWVAYCNESAAEPMGALRASHGFPEPWNVRYWGLGNEVWGDWQIGHTDASGYVERIGAFINLMKKADPDIRLVAVGLDHLEGDPRNAEGWNRRVLESIGKHIDYISFHIYQPSEEGYRPTYDQEELFRCMMAAPLSVEDGINRMAGLIKTIFPNRIEGAPFIALDEWNAKYPPPAGAKTMHQQYYTLRDSLYVAGMFNVFHRCCEVLKMANLSMLVNVLPAIRKGRGSPAELTPVGLPFQLYRKMEEKTLPCMVESPLFDTPALGLNISEKKGIPLLDASATCNAENTRLAISLINRHPRRRIKVHISGLRLGCIKGTCLQSAHFLSNKVELVSITIKTGARGEARLILPPASVTVLESDDNRT